MKVSTSIGPDMSERADDTDALERACVRAERNIAHLRAISAETYTPTQRAMLARDLTTHGDLLRIEGKNLTYALAQLREAIALWNALRKEKALLMAERKLALALLEDTQYAEALRLFDTLLERTSKEPSLVLYTPFLFAERARVLHALKRTCEAREDIDQAIAMFEAKGVASYVEKLTRIRAFITASDDA